MSWRDVWKTDSELERERRDLRDEWPSRSYDREYEVENRVRDIDRELRHREERREEEAAAERAAQRRAHEAHLEQRWQEQQRMDEEEWALQQYHDEPVQEEVLDAGPAEQSNAQS